MIILPLPGSLLGSFKNDAEILGSAWALPVARCSWSTTSAGPGTRASAATS